MNPRITFIRVLVLALLLAAPLVGAAGVRAHPGGPHLIQGEAAWRTFDSLSVLRGASGSSGVTGASTCTRDDRRAKLAAEQTKVLALVGDLGTLRDENDLALLAARGWSLATHWQASVRGMGFAVANVLEPDATGAPTLLLYAPNPTSPDVTDDEFDFPYTLRGWGYAPAYVPGNPPALLASACVRPTEWFVHERGIHDFETRNFVPVAPAEDVQGEDPGANPPAAVPPDFPHSRLWDIHFWLGTDGVPTISLLNPGRLLPGHDPRVGTAFFYPPAADDRYVQRGCHELVSLVDVNKELADSFVPDRFEVVPTERGDAMLVLRTASCDTVSVNGGPGRVTKDVKFGIQIASPYGEGRILDAYALFFATDNSELARFFRRGTNFGNRAVEVPGLSYVFDRTLGGAFSFEAPSPTPSPFAVEGVASRPAASIPDAEVAWWIEDEDGAAGFFSQRHTLKLGAAQVEISPQPGTQMATLLGAKTTRPVSLSNGIDEGTTGKLFVPCDDRCGG
jgi:hypothetical protein